MSSLADSLAWISQRYREEHGVDLALEQVAALDRSDPAQWLADVRCTIENRSEALKHARKDLRRLGLTAEYLESILPFTAEGWPAREAELQEGLQADPAGGLIGWLGDWLTAAGAGRLDALERLQGLALPDGARLLRERAESASYALYEIDPPDIDAARLRWQLAAPLLSLGAAIEPPSGDAAWTGLKRHLHLLLTRLAIAADLAEEAERALARVERTGRGADTRTLRSRLARLRGDQAGAEGHLRGAKALSSSELELTVELVTGAKRDGSAQPAADLAKAGIDALPLLDDVEANLARLMRDVPAEIWIAVAERASREGNAETTLRAVEQALAAGAADDYAAVAVAYELRAGALHQMGSPAPEVAAVLVSAGDARSFARQFEHGSADFARALEFDPDNIEAKLGYCDCVCAWSSDQPVAAIQEAVQHAADLVKAALAAQPITRERSWGYLVQAAICAQQARCVLPGRSSLLARRLAAASLAVSYAPEIGRRWSTVADAAATLGLYEVAVSAARHALRRSQDDDIVATAIRAYANAGRYADAMKLLEGRSEQWAMVVRAALLLHMERRSACLNAFEATQIDPQWLWARQTKATAYMVCGRWDEGLKEAAEILAVAQEIGLDEHDNRLDAAAAAALISEHAEQAEVWARELDEVDDLDMKHSLTAEIIAISRLVRGDRDGCFDELVRMVGEFRSRHQPAAWAHVLRPQLQAIATGYGVELPDLDHIDALVQGKAAALEGIGPQDELQHSKASDASSASTLHSVLLAMIEWADGQVEDAKAALNPEYSDSSIDQAIAAISGQIEAEADGASSGEAEAEWDGQPHFRLELPQSWFEDVEDPVNEHPLFVRYLPEARIRTPLPGVNVSVDEALEPGGYRLIADGAPVESGSVDPRFRYCDAGALTLLPELQAARASEAASTIPGLVPVYIKDAGEGNGASPLAMLLTMDAVEAVVRQLAAQAPSAEPSAGAAVPIP